MNERVWLQSTVTFVNTKQAISIGFLATFLTFGCSKPDDSIKIDKKAPKSETVLTQTTLPKAPIIWESNEAADKIVDLAIGKTESNTLFELAILADGRAEAFDIDGISIAQSKTDSFSKANAGISIQIANESFIAYPTLTNGSEIQAALFSPNLPIIAAAPFELNETVDVLCSTTFDMANPNSFNNLAYITNNQIIVANVVLGGASPSLQILATHPISNETTSCMYNGEIGVAFAKKSVTTFTEQKILTTSKLDFTPQDATFIFNSSLALLSSDSKLFTTKIETNGKLTNLIEFELSDGMSVSAPERITHISAASGKINVDYPAGLMIVTGEYADQQNRLSFVSLAPLETLYGEKIIQPEKPIPESDYLESVIEKNKH